MARDLDTFALDEQRRRVGDQVADLTRELEEIAASTALVPDDEHDAEGSTLGYERARVGALLQRAEAQQAALEAAAARLRHGVAPTCAECGSPLGAERLAALPGTTTCVSCAARPAGGGVSLGRR